MENGPLAVGANLPESVGCVVVAGQNRALMNGCRRVKISHTRHRSQADTVSFIGYLFTA